MTSIRGAMLFSVLCLAGTPSLPAQPDSVLHVKVTLPDAEGTPRPVPRHALLISDNPPTSSPRRVVTAADGSVDVKLRPGNYTVESDEPVASNGKAYRWTQMIEVVAGRDATLLLTGENADVDAVAPADAPADAPVQDGPAVPLPRWQDSVVTLWTPVAHAIGVLVDARGLVLTSRRVLGDASSVDVQLTPAVKVTGRVVVAYPARDVAVLWIDPAVAASLRPLPPDCQAASASPVAVGQEVFAVDASIRNERRLVSGTVTGLESQGALVDFRTEPRSAGGPVFAAGGGVIGLTSLADEASERTRGYTRIVGAADACEILKSAERQVQGATPPSGTLLPVEPARPFPADVLEDAARRGAALSPYQVTSSDFDIAFITPQLVYAAQHRWGGAGGRDRGGDPGWSDATRDRFRVLTDFGNWSEYVAGVPPVLLVRVTPRFAEGFWTTVGRAAAYTQGVSLPPFKHFKPGFSRMQAFCGTVEVTPIHGFTLEQRVSEDTAIREGLYAFDPDALGPACKTVKLVLFSEKAPAKGDTKLVDPGVLEQIWRDFAPYRTAPRS